MLRNPPRRETLPKQQGSYRQVTSTAVKQDLVISAYKPTEVLTERFSLGSSPPENAWAFVAEHLRHVPVFSSVDGIAEIVAERTAQVLHDRMVAFHVQRRFKEEEIREWATDLREKLLAAGASKGLVDDYFGGDPYREPSSRRASSLPP